MDRSFGQVRSHSDADSPSTSLRPRVPHRQELRSPFCHESRAILDIAKMSAISPEKEKKAEAVDKAENKVAIQ